MECGKAGKMFTFFFAYFQINVLAVLEVRELLKESFFWKC